MVVFGFAFIALAFVVGWLISAGLLKLSCRICKVPVPRLGGAMLMIAAIMVTGIVVEVVAGVLLGFTDPTIVMEPQNAGSLASLASIPIHAAIAASFYRALLPSTFPRALLVWFVHAVLTVVLAIIIIVPITLILGGLAAASAG